MKFILARFKIWRQAQENPLLVVTTPYRLALEKTQRQYALFLICVLLGIGYYSYIYIQNQAQSNRLVSLASAKKDLNYPHVLTAEDLAWVEVPLKWAPQGSYKNVADLLGKTLRRDVVKNEVLVLADVVQKQDPNSITAQFTEGFAFSVGEDWLVSKLPSLSRGDLVDVLVTNPKLNTDSTLKIAESLSVIEVENIGGRKNLVLQVTPAQAESLLFSRGLRLPMQVLVYSAESLSTDNF